LMKRFGSMELPQRTQVLWQEHTSRFRQRMELETMRRSAQMELQGSGLISSSGEATALNNKPSKVRACTLSVVIQKMRNLPSMDIFRGCDAMCKLFFEGSPGLYQTEVRRGMKEEDWTWDRALSDNFQWDLPMDPEHLLPDRKVVVIVFDKDQVSRDDLVGCVTVSLRELGDSGVFDGWKRIARPPHRTELPWHNPSVGELLLSVTLTPKGHYGSGEPEWQGLGLPEDTILRPAKQRLSPFDSLDSSQVTLQSSLGYAVGHPPLRDRSGGTDGGLHGARFTARPAPPPPIALQPPWSCPPQGVLEAPVEMTPSSLSSNRGPERPLGCVKGLDAREGQAVQEGLSRVPADDMVGLARQMYPGPTAPSAGHGSQEAMGAHSASSHPAAFQRTRNPAPSAPAAGLRESLVPSECPWPCSPEYRSGVARGGPLS
jgi:hypothetical protein